MGGTLIEIHEAYCFDCDECGRENFFRVVNRETENLEISEEAQQLKDDGWDVSAMFIPESVECEFCKTEFQIEVTNNDIQ